MTNLQRYEEDLQHLIDMGDQLHISMQAEQLPDKLRQTLEERVGDKANEFLDNFPKFSEEYQSWYSEAYALIKQLMPHRLPDFVRHYEKPKSRKEITYENYVIEDCLQGLTVTRGVQKEKVVGPEAAIPRFRQQVAIVKAAKRRFKSTLYDIKLLVQADLFDSELDASSELVKNGFIRAAGALAGVVLERHLKQVCNDHSVRIRKKKPTISDLNNLLREGDVIELPDWRFIQHLADIRNLCDHSKETDPTSDQVHDLIAGVTKVTKTLF